MTGSHEIGNERRKVADLFTGELRSLITAVVIECLKRFLSDVIPQRDPDEDIYWTTQQAAEYLGVCRQTVQNNKEVIGYEGEGRTTRFTKAACKRYFREHGVPSSSIGKRIENPIRKRFTRKKKG